MRHRSVLGCLVIGILTLTGCYQFESVEHPHFADTNSTFEATFNIALTENGGAFPILRIFTPRGWVIEDSIEYTGAVNGTFFFVDSFNHDHGTEWNFEGKEYIQHYPDGHANFTVVIHTDTSRGNFNIHYNLDQNPGGWHYDGEHTSHWISVGTPESVTVTSTADSGPGSLRKAIHDVRWGGSIDFDLPHGSVIQLNDHLNLNRQVHIDGGLSEPTLRGGIEHGVFQIECRDSVAISNLRIANSFRSAISLRGDYYWGYWGLRSSALEDFASDRIPGSIEEYLSEAGDLPSGMDIPELQAWDGPIPIPGTALHLSNVELTHNRTEGEGGAIHSENAHLYLENVRIVGNAAGETGGGIAAWDTKISFDPDAPSTIHSNNAPLGADLSSNTPITVHVDTFSVSNPNTYYAHPTQNFDFNIETSLDDLISSDVYVSTTGDDTNSGLSPDKPFKTISHALSVVSGDSLNPINIHLADGWYRPFNQIEGRPILVPSYINIIGESISGTVIDGQRYPYPVFEFFQTVQSGISHLTVLRGLDAQEERPAIQSDGSSGITLNNLLLNHNHGSGVSVYNSEITLDSCVIRSNHAGDGGGIIADQSQLAIKNTLIEMNEAHSGGGIRTWFSEVSLAGTTIRRNVAEGEGGGCYFSESTVDFSSADRCNVYENQAENGTDFWAEYWEGNEEKLVINLDTCTVKYPGDFHAFSLKYFEFDILHGLVDQVESDVYVAPFGNDANDGLSWETAFRTIDHAQKVQAVNVFEPYAIHLANGRYYNSTRAIGGYPLRINSYTRLIGQSREGVILDGSSDHTALEFWRSEGAAVSNLTIQRCNDSGIRMYDSDPLLSDMTLKNNQGYGGGAIQCRDRSFPIFNNLEIFSNSADEGGGIYIDRDSNPVFSRQQRCSIFSNAAYRGSDMFKEPGSGYWSRGGWVDEEPSDPVHIYLDTCTVAFPTDLTMYPAEKFISDILNFKIQQIDADIYVSPSGNDLNSGTSPENALKSITKASQLILSRPFEPRRIHLAPGVYSPSMTGEEVPLRFPDHVTVLGDKAVGSIIDAEQDADAVVRLDYTQGFRAENLILVGGEHIGLISERSESALVNVTITANGNGRGIECYNDSKMMIVNSIIRDDRADTEPALSFWYNDYLVAVNSNIKLSPEDWDVPETKMATWWENNIDTTAGFETGSREFNLSESSACVNAGTALFVWEGDTIVNLSASDYKGPAPDMGAIESSHHTRIVGSAEIPGQFHLYQNYPNPFNPVTHIRYDIPATEDVRLVLYDIRGREVFTLVEEEQVPGSYEIMWNGLDSRGREVAAGMYFCRLTTSDHVQVRKLVYIR